MGEDQEPGSSLTQAGRARQPTWPRESWGVSSLTQHTVSASLPTTSAGCWAHMGTGSQGGLHG